MTISKLAPAILAALLGTTALAAAQSTDTSFTPEQAGMLLVRGRLINVNPLNSTSSVSLIGGKVTTTDQFAPEVDLSYFLTRNIAFELIAATTRHSITATGTALGRVPVGSTWVLPPTLTVQYHILPDSRFSPYVGAGVNVTFFYATSPAGPTVTKLGLDSAVGPAIQAGFDYALSGPWVLNVDVKQIFINTTAHLNGSRIIAKTALNPTVIGVGVGYKF